MHLLVVSYRNGRKEVSVYNDADKRNVNASDVIAEAVRNNNGSVTDIYRVITATIVSDKTFRVDRS